MFVKTRLMTPGPTTVAESTRQVLGASHPHHRSAEFRELLRGVLGDLRWLWDTDDDVLFITGSGTAGMEASLRSVLRPGDSVVVVTGGKFASRWRDVAEAIEARVTTLDVDWGRSAQPEALEALLAQMDAPPVALIAVASETSTGALHPIPELGAVLRKRAPDALLLVDGITAVGCVDLSMRRDGIDILVSGTQKAFGVPPGGALVGVSAAAWRAAERARAEGRTAPFYLDLLRERGQTTGGQTAFTPSVPLVLALREVMARWRSVGRDALFAHTRALSEATVAGTSAMGLAPFAVDEASPALTSVKLPDGVSAATIRAALRDRLGVTVAGGQGPVKDDVLRIGHIGHVDPFDVVTVLAALEVALEFSGHPVEAGAGVSAALGVLRRAFDDDTTLLTTP